jgi:tetratricopeptide (TPR) repeat protein
MGGPTKIDVLKKSAMEHLQGLRYRDAVGIFHKLIRHYDQSNMHFEKAETLFLLGKVFYDIGDYSTSVSSFEDSIEIFSNLNFYEDQANVTIYLGIAYRNVDDLIFAKQAFLSAAELYENLGLEAFKEVMYTQSQNYYLVASEIYSTAEEIDRSAVAKYMALEAEIHYFKDLSRAANMNFYQQNYKDASKYAWRTLTIAMGLIKKVYKFEADKRYFANEMIQESKFLKRAINSNPNLQNGNIEAKIEEFRLFLKQIFNNTLKEKNVFNIVESFESEFRGLLPQENPQFLFFTNQGLLLHYVRATEDLETIAEEETNNALFANILTAIQASLTETKSPAQGQLTEIHTGDNTLIIESGSKLICVGVIGFSYPEFNRFLRSLCDDLEDTFQEEINSFTRWGVGGSNLNILKNHINSKIKEHLENEYIA